MAANLKNKVTQFLSQKTISVLIVLLAIGSRLLQLVFFYNIRVDGMYQYLAMKYFVNGHGVSIAEVLPTDLSQPLYEPLINWPPGYSILLSPFYKLFNHNYVAAGLTLDLLAATALIIFARKILKLLDLPLYLINIYTIFTGFFIYNFYFIASSDAIAISFFVVALYLALLLLKTNSQWLVRTILISALLITCGFIKYLFYPVVLVIPVFLIIKGLTDKEKVIKKAGLFSFFLVAICLVSLLVYQKNISGAAAYISQPERGFFPENLSLAYPFIPGAIINPESITRVLSNLKSAENSIFRLFQWIQILSILCIVTCMIVWVRKNGIRKLATINSFYCLTIFITLAITGLLLFLSLTVAKEEINPGVFWSYIEDARYHGLITMLFQMSLFVIIHQLWVSGNKKWRFIPALIFLLLLPETFRGIIFGANRIRKINIEEYSWQSELRFQQFVENIIANKRKFANFQQTVVTGTSYYFNYRVCIYSNAFYLRNSASIETLKTSENVLLLYITNKMLPNTEHHNSNPEKLMLDGSFMNFNIYSKIIEKR